MPSRHAPGFASVALRPWLNAPARPARIIGASTQFAWCVIDGEVVLLATPDAIRFPNAVLTCAGWDRLVPGATVMIGNDALVGERVACRIVRWWDPRVAPTVAVGSDVRAATDRLARSLTSSRADVGLADALASGDPAALLERAIGLLGRGRGLTPEGDDVMIGAIAAFRHVTASLGHPEAAGTLDDVVEAVLALASDVTTLLSATLLRHAFAGELADPVADLLRGLTGNGDLSAAALRCLAIGHSSGSALAHGVWCGARAGCEVAS